MDDLYPIEFNGKEYTQEEADPVFDSFYHTKYALNGNNGVYMADGVWIYPDGSMDEW